MKKKLVKQLEARWDPEAKKWYVPDTLDREAFKRWWPKGAEEKIKSHLRVVK